MKDHDKTLVGRYYLSLSAVIQTAVNLQHIQGLKKTKPRFKSTGDITLTPIQDFAT
jgi:hypothetical protein